MLDAIGGKSLKRSYDLLRPGGRLVAYGFSAMQQGDKRSLRTALPQLLPMLRGFNLVKQLSESKAVIGLNMLRLWDDRGTLEPWIGPLSTALADGVAVPVVHEAVRSPKPLRHTAFWPRARTSAKWCWCPRRPWPWRARTAPSRERRR